MIEFGHATHTGLHREHNEDTYWADAGLGLFLVADGMGGHGRGELAAAMGRDAIVAAALGGHALEPAIRDAGNAIARRAAEAKGHSPMGTTLAVLRLDAEQYRAVCVGDSSILLWQHGHLQRIDNSSRTAPPRADVARSDPEHSDSGSASAPHNWITQALGISPPAALCLEPVAGKLERGMQFLLSSDGLSDAIDTPAIASILARSDLAAQECVDHLLLTALDAGARDNVTALLVRVT